MTERAGEREAFEAWQVSLSDDRIQRRVEWREDGPMLLHRTAEGRELGGSSVGHAWAAWQARAALTRTRVSRVEAFRDAVRDLIWACWKVGMTSAPVEFKNLRDATERVESMMDAEEWDALRAALAQPAGSGEAQDLGRDGGVDGHAASSPRMSPDSKSVDGGTQADVARAAEHRTGSDARKPVSRYSSPARHDPSRSEAPAPAAAGPVDSPKAEKRGSPPAPQQASSGGGETVPQGTGGASTSTPAPSATACPTCEKVDALAESFRVARVRGTGLPSEVNDDDRSKARACVRGMREASEQIANEFADAIRWIALQECRRDAGCSSLGSCITERCETCYARAVLGRKPEDEDDAAPPPAAAEPVRCDPSRGVWFRSAVSGLLYRDLSAAGSVSEVTIDGERFVRAPEWAGDAPSIGIGLQDAAPPAPAPTDKED